MKSKTKAESDWLARVAARGCIVCERMGYPDSPAEIHHVRFLAGASQKAPHIGGTIPLCWRHHAQQSEHGFHAAPEEWQDLNGTEKELLDIVNAEMGEF